MEDRPSAGLYLELGDWSPAAYEARAGDLAGRPGVDRVTWWANCRPGRDELPMRIPDGTLLGVCETGAGFTPPEPPAGAAAFTFRRHRRPAQGILTGRPTRGLIVVLITPREPELDDALRDWGDFVHIRHIAAAAVPGYTQIAVYERDGDPRFLHCYELDTDDAEAAYQDMPGRVADRLGGPGTDAYREWADWRAGGGRLWYCNTFTFLGERPGAQPEAASASSNEAPRSSSGR